MKKKHAHRHERHNDKPAMAKAQQQAKRVPLWLPYLQSIKEHRNGVYEFEYNGGAEKTGLDDVSSIMIYGDVDTPLEIVTIDKIVRRGIPIIVHRRNMTQPVYITGGLRPDPDDTITEQLVKRRQSRATTHIARQLLQAKMRSMSYLVKPSAMPQFASLKKLRNIEAVHARRYWDAYYKRLGHPEWARRSKNPASQNLDSVSKFLTGIILRWVTYHHLSPYHGFLHEPTNYPALIYDLIEPYRGMFEARILQTMLLVPEDKWVAASIEELKDMLNERVYVPLTRQIVTRQELLHGIVLSLKYYLLGRQRKFLIPLEGKPNGGRPPKVEFLLYGRHAGKTDFWQVARDVSKNT